MIETSDSTRHVSRWILRRVAPVVVAAMLVGFLWYKGAARQFPAPPRPELVGVADQLSSAITATIDRLEADSGDVDALFELGLLYHANGYLSEAEQCYRLLDERLISQSELAKLYYYKADIAKEFGDLESAKVELVKVLAVDDRYLPAILSLAEARYKAGEREAAIQAYREALAMDPSSPSALTALSRDQAQSGNDARALEYLEALLAKHPRAATGKSLLAQLLERRGESAKAAEVREELAQSWDPPLEDPWMDELMDRCYDSQRLNFTFEDWKRVGRLDHAFRYLDRIEKLYPEKWEHELSRGLAYVETGRFEEGAEAFATAIQRGGDPALLYPQLVKALLELGRIEDAERAARQGLELAPDAADLLAELAGVKLVQGAIPEATRLFERSLKIDPHNLRALRFLSKILIKLGREQEAIARLEVVRRISPFDLASRIQIGSYYLQGPKPEKALEPLQEAYAIDTGDDAIRALLAHCRIKLGNDALSRGDAGSALVHFESVVEVDPSSVAGHTRRVQLLVQAKRYADAEMAMRPLLELGSANPATQLSYGDIQYASGKRTEALESWRAALEMLEDSGDSDLRAAIALRLKSADAGGSN